MPARIRIILDGLEFQAELNASGTAEKLLSLLPLEFTMSRWGDEYYGDCGIEAEETDEARTVMEAGELAVWPVGRALCIFFGPTPASTDERPVAASPVNPVGRLLDSPDRLKGLGETVQAKVEPAAG